MAKKSKASSPFQPSPWTNQDIVLYHGTLNTHAKAILANGVSVNRGRTRTDFGRGFYTTTVKQQADSWAWQLSQRNPGTLPAVIRFDVDRDALANLESLWFVRGSFNAHDYWSLVFHCRSGRNNHARKTNQVWYDVVIGPVAASWRQRLTIYDADQVSFHTLNGANVLNQGKPKTDP